jgi:hypothetical protein
MAIGLGILLMAVGGLAALAGLTAARRAERLRSYGQTAWAMVVSAPADEAGDSGDFGETPGRRVLLQYRLPDGAVMERPASRLAPGASVLVWYDPADPGDILVLGRDGRLNAAFLAVGILFILLGAAIGGFAH